jgi:hypothetical protein
MSTRIHTKVIAAIAVSAMVAGVVTLCASADSAKGTHIQIPPALSHLQEPGSTGWVPQGTSSQPSAGELARSEALNKRYHGEYSPAAQAGPKPEGMTAQQWQAELARGNALNRRYGLGAYAKPAVAASPAQTSSASGTAKIDPLAVGYLIGHGYTPAQVSAWTVGACSHEVKPAACFGPSKGADLVARPVKVDPLAVGYLTGRGLSPSEVRSWTVGACSHAVKPASCFAALDDRQASATAATVTVTPSRGFDWADAAIGAGAALGLALASAGALMALHKRRTLAHV